MAAPADVSVLAQSRPDAELDAIRQQVNNLTESVRLLTAKLDADVGVTDTNYDALITDTAIATAPAVIERVLG